VEVFIKRDFQNIGKWILENAQEELDPGEVVAHGVPVAVTLLTPLWVVNATGLAIDAAVVQVPPPPQVRFLDEYYHYYYECFTHWEMAT